MELRLFSGGSLILGLSKKEIKRHLASLFQSTRRLKYEGGQSRVDYVSWHQLWYHIVKDASCIKETRRAMGDMMLMKIVKECRSTISEMEKLLMLFFSTVAHTWWFLAYFTYLCMLRVKMSECVWVGGKCTWIGVTQIWNCLWWFF